MSHNNCVGQMAERFNMCGQITNSCFRKTQKTITPWNLFKLSYNPTSLNDLYATTLELELESTSVCGVSESIYE